MIYYARSCPFCKCNKVMVIHEVTLQLPYYVECVECFAHGPMAKDEDDAFKLWNTRKYGCVGD